MGQGTTWLTASSILMQVRCWAPCPVVMRSQASNYQCLVRKQGQRRNRQKRNPPLGGEARDGAAPKKEDPPPFTLGEGLPPVPSKLVAKIHKGDFVDMAELLRDNIEAERRYSWASNPDTPSSIPGRREVPDLFSWVQCFGVYAAVVSSKSPEKVQ